MTSRFARVALLAGAAALWPSATQAGIGDLQGTKPGDLMFPGFADADTCATCHGGGVAGDTSFLASDSWAGTMMANAARDPVFLASVSVANQDMPGVGGYCLRCHTPIGFVEGHTTPPDGSALDAVDLQGVGCDTCHRAVESPAPGPFLLGDAQLYYVEDPTYHGPYADSMSPAHPTAALASLSDSRFCGQCHQVTNPEVHLKDATGADTGLEFPLDTTYAEWAASDVGKAGSASFRSCIGCHMQPKKGSFPVTSLAGATARTDPRDHAFVGGNVWGVAAVQAANPDRAQKLAPAFALAAQRARDFLGTAATVELSGAPPVINGGDQLSVTVRVTNLTGHKFPTGYAESRRAWIALVLVEPGMKETALAGGYEDATGAIQASPPTRVYRAQHGRWDGQKGQPDEHVALHDMVISDTRIPPLGFVADPTTTPSSEIDFGDGQGGYRNYDEATFTLTAPAGVTGATLSARVYYQAMTRDHVTFLRDADTTDARGMDLEAIYQATGEAAPLLIASSDVMASSTSSSGSGGGGSAGGTSTGSGGAGATSGTGGSPAPGSKGGCGCRTAESGSGEAAAAMVAVALAVSAARRRRRG